MATWEEFVADVERDVAQEFDAGGKYDIGEGILKAFHRRLTALEPQPAEEAAGQPAEQPADLAQRAEQPDELTPQ